MDQTAAPQLPPTAALLRATIAQIATYLPQADNLGVSGDWRDLYFLVDYVGFAVDRAYPAIPCAKGCAHCCDNQLFRVSQAEWQRVREGLMAMPAERRRGLVERAQAWYAEHRPALEAAGEAWSAGLRAPLEQLETAPTRCPLLLDGRCTVYDERPAICRGYGYFSATIAETASLLICKQEGPAWVQQLEASGIDQLPMPNWNPVQRQVEAINGARGVKPLPLWLLEEAEGLLGE